MEAEETNDIEALPGYRPETYGERFAERYDELYTGLDDVEAVTAFLESVIAPTRDEAARVLELAVGTGRLALPLARRGHQVTGIDVSPAMLERLRGADTDALVATVVGDMADDTALPGGPFDLVFVAYNSLFMLTDAAAQRRCFAAVARRLAPRAPFVVEAFVPDPERPAGTRLEVRSMTSDRVVLAATDHDPLAQVAAGHLIELVDGEPVRLRPYVVRYSTVAELDTMAAAAGLRVSARYADTARRPFDDHSERHVTVYRRA